MSLSKDALDTIIDAAVVANGGLSLDTATPAILVPNGYSVKPLEHLHARPARFRGHFHTSVIADFASYVKQHATGESAGFVDPDSMKAHVLFDLGSAKLPGHIEHHAALQLKPTAEYAALIQASSSVFTQRELTDWIEDWAPQITAKTATGDDMSLVTAIDSIRRMRIEAKSERGSEVSDVGAKRSAIEEIEAKSQGELPYGFTFNCTPYHNLNPITARLRLSVLTGDDKLKFRLRWMQREAQQQEIADDFRDTLRSELDGTIPLTLGTFTKP